MKKLNERYINYHKFIVLKIKIFLLFSMGNIVQRRLLTTGIFLTAFFLTGIGFCRTASAQSQEEMQTLRLFYQEKDLVISATRNPKPVSQVAENVTVIRAQDIEAMNAHTVAEVLNRVPGLFVNFNQDFGANSLISIQGSEQRHVLVLVDGIPWNFLSEGSAETNSIPVGIIERIEIIKGPASSAWGSSLGGVINILTKSAGTTEKPTGMVKASYGKGNTQDYSAQVSGLAGPVGYYLFAGRQESDGLKSSKGFASESYFSKFSIPVAKGIDLGLTMGISKPKNHFGDVPSGDTTTSSDARSSFLAATIRASLTPDLDLSLSVHTVEQKTSLSTDTLGLGILSPTPQFLLENTADERTTGARGKLVWTKGLHTAVLGIDADRGTLDQTLQAGPTLQSFGLPATSAVQPAITKWALYANDTIALDRWTITPGIRYDYNSIIGSFVSPSLGVTYKLGENSLARASVARGFTLPPLSATSSGGLFLEPNPALQHESVWSYQAGLESAITHYLWIKGTIFYHKLDNQLMREAGAAGPPTNNDLIVNKGNSRRQGLELEAETLPWHNVSAIAGFAYVAIKSDSETESRGRYAYNLGVKYDDRKSWQAQLFGHYIWWDLDGAFQADYGDFIWDLNLARKIIDTRQFAAQLFLTAHNIFDGDQYTLADSKNPGRWVEAGIKTTF
ncbi:MAG: TonB-dependent receptor [Deltaproteobacteria bacterium]|nr:TonB-dependent receptor [Deltaproteobacteria bacterium]